MKMKTFIAIAIFIAGTSTAFAQQNNEKETGDLPVKTENRTIAAFDNIDISGRFNVTLYNNATPEVSVTTAEKYIGDVETKVEGKTLIIKMKNLIGNENVTIIDGIKTKYNDYFIRKPIEIKIGIGNISVINLAGITNVESNETWRANELFLSFNEASKARLTVEVSNKLDVNLSGASKLDVKGKATNFNIGVHGASSLQAKDLKSQHAKVALSGAGRAEIFASESLDAELKSASKLICTGSPKSIKQNASMGTSISVK